MGVKYELNWYLVLDNNPDLILYEPKSVIKNEGRIYPLDSPIPIIIKNEGCIGMVIIKKFTITKNSTELECELVKTLHVNNPIALHYRYMYHIMKSDDIDKYKYLL